MREKKLKEPPAQLSVRATFSVPGQFGFLQERTSELEEQVRISGQQVLETHQSMKVLTLAQMCLCLSPHLFALQQGSEVTEQKCSQEFAQHAVVMWPCPVCCAYFCLRGTLCSLKLAGL